MAVTFSEGLPRLEVKLELLGCLLLGELSE